MRTAILFALTLSSLSSAAAQTQSGETFKAGVTVIQVPVVVRDHDGRVVSNLVKDDFQLFDNGKRQEITSFSVENPGSQAVPDRSVPGAGAPAAQSAGATGMDIPARFIAFFFDDLTIRDPGDFKRIRDAAAGQLAALLPGDRAAIFTSSCRIELDFTNDRAKLQETVARLQLLPVGICRVSQSQVLQAQLLKKVIGRMSTLPARRDIILVSSGFYIGHDRSSELTTTVDAAVLAKVSIHTVDIGETTSYGTPAGNTMDPSPRGRFINPTNPIVLEDLSRGTGGTYVAGNDFAFSFRRLSTPESHYLLGFVPSRPDGRFHQLKVKLENARKLTVEARSGYDAPKRSE